MLESLFKKNLKYLVIGAGAVGATFACLLKGANKNVTLISKYNNLIKKAYEQGGIRLISNIKDDKRYKLNFKTEAEYKEKADVIIICVYDKDIETVFPLVEKALKDNTIIFTTADQDTIGSLLEEKFPNRVLNAGFNAKCRWYDRQNVEYMQQGEVCELVLTPKNKNSDKNILKQIEKDITKAGIKTFINI